MSEGRRGFPARDRPDVGRPTWIRGPNGPSGPKLERTRIVRSRRLRRRRLGALRRGAWPSI